jgi:hypothetical protein
VRDGSCLGKERGAVGGHGVFSIGCHGGTILASSTHQSLSVLGLGKRGSRSLGVVGRERRRGRRGIGTGGHWLSMWTAPVACGEGGKGGGSIWE